MSDERRDGAVARLMLAASVIDVMVTGIALKTVILMGEFDVGRPRLMLLFVLSMILTWLISDWMLVGASIGRFAMGVSLRRTDGRRLTAAQGFWRFLRKAMSFGLAGIRLDGPAWYDRREGIRARIALDIRPVESWHLVAVNGPDRKRRIRLGDSESFRRMGRLQIGSKPPCDFRLPSCDLVSGTHCELQLDNKRLLIRDVGSHGGGSTNGTWVDGERLEPGVYRNVTTADRLRLADIHLKIYR